MTWTKRTKWLVGSGVAFVLLIALLVCGAIILGSVWLIRDNRRLDAKYPIKRESASAPRFEWIEVSAKQLSDDYVSNSMAADDKYRGQHLAVSGTVESVIGRAGVTSFVSLDAGGLKTIRCEVREQYETKAMELRRGDSVKLLGMCEGNNSLSIMLSDCAIIR